MSGPKRLATHILMVILFMSGIGLMLYPTVSNWWNDLHQSKAVQAYDKIIEQIDQKDYTQMLEAARAYNKHLRQYGIERFSPTEEESEWYNSLLDVTGNGIMGYIEVPKLDIKLPIYHGTGDAILQFAIGHLEGSSLPTGEDGTHVALSGHTGLPSAKLFTHLISMERGDTFTVVSLAGKMLYTIDRVEVVEPEDMKLLEITDGPSRCTLITCTPYGVNSHRLLVRGTLSDIT